MADKGGRWSWDVPGFEPPQPATTTAAAVSVPTAMPRAPPTAMVFRPSAGAPRAAAGAVPVAERLDQLADSVQLAREDCLELRQEASDLLEYSNAKLGRVTRYLGFLADRTRKLDQAALETEARITPLIHEKKRLFNDLLTLKGNVKVFCRSRPLYEDEGPSVVEFPDDFTIRVNTGDESLTNSKKDYEFDRVYGPHIGQGELFHDVQPFVQSALDGYNISIFAYGQSCSGKTHTLGSQRLRASGRRPTLLLAMADGGRELAWRHNDSDLSPLLAACGGGQAHLQQVDDWTRAGVHARSALLRRRTGGLRSVS